MAKLLKRVVSGGDSGRFSFFSSSVVIADDVEKKGGELCADEAGSGGAAYPDENIVGEPNTNGSTSTMTKKHVVDTEKVSSLSVGAAAGSEYREMLLRNVKKEVKQLMEEAVTRKFINEESSSITSLCGAVEACLLYGLQRRALGLFRDNSTTALLVKIAKENALAELVLNKIQNQIGDAGGGGGGGGFPARNTHSLNLSTQSSLEQVKKENTRSGSVKMRPTHKNKYVWIRIALLEKSLGKIVEFLVENGTKYYERDSIVADACDGPLLASLLMGPCALDFSKLKTYEHLWTDPPAGELVQRHKIYSANFTSANAGIAGGALGHTTSSTVNKAYSKINGAPCSPLTPLSGINSPIKHKPSLMIRRHTSSSSEDSSLSRSAPGSAKDYVESLHQNQRSTLLYGKNNVLVQPSEDIGRLPGYLSLHCTARGLTVKWTPNQLMNSTTTTTVAAVAATGATRSTGSLNSNKLEDNDCQLLDEKDEDALCGENQDDMTIEHETDRRNVYLDKLIRNCGGTTRFLFWDYALTINIEEIVYIHCHQTAGFGGTAVLVGQDGVQRPPLHFQPGGHLLAFLTCLESGLAPRGQLDPPLWVQRGKGKVFPKLRRRSHAQHSVSSNLSGSSGSEDQIFEEDDPMDYVFRIVFTTTDANTDKISGSYENNTAFPWHPNLSSEKLAERCGSTETCLMHRHSIKQLCDTMRTQILSRAFFGWLAYCRHLKTVRTHFADLVNAEVSSPPESGDAARGLTPEVWRQLRLAPVSTASADQLHRLVFYGGCAMEIRKEVWPFLLGHYEWQSDEKSRAVLDESVRQSYETTMSEWLAVEAIVRQRDKETLQLKLREVQLKQAAYEAANKELSSSSTTEMTATAATIAPILLRQSSFDNDVFDEAKKTEDNTPDDEGKPASPDPDPEEKSLANNGTADSKLLLFEDSLETNISTMTECHDSNGTFIVTNPSVDSGLQSENGGGGGLLANASTLLPCGADESSHLNVDDLIEGSSRFSTSCESLISPASPASNGGIYSAQLLDDVALNIHRIDKDVARCDRNHAFFNATNLDKLRNIMCTYVWENLEVGYVQGMCDIVAPLLVILQDEALTYACFQQLMKRMTLNFPHGGAMDTHFANMRSLIQVLDPEMFEHMQKNGDFTHFYFCYRWFLLDFKRELIYNDVFYVWEVIWAAKHVATKNFGLFFALALIEYYREIIIDNDMDFTDIIKFFNEMAERHSVRQVAKLARDIIFRMQSLMDTT